MHLARRVSDRSQFQSGFLREMTDYLKSCRADNIPVYGIALGDLAWDQYWYENDYDLNDYQNDLKSLDFPVFSAPGNHDNDPTVANDDFAAAGPSGRSSGQRIFRSTSETYTTFCWTTSFMKIRTESTARIVIRSV